MIELSSEGGVVIPAKLGDLRLTGTLGGQMVLAKMEWKSVISADVTCGIPTSSRGASLCRGDTEISYCG
jgi:hypothetical protein